MRSLSQALMRILLLQAAAAPAWSRSPTDRDLAAQHGTRELCGKAEEGVEDKFDAFQELFNDGVVGFEDDGDDYGYIDVGFVDAAEVAAGSGEETGSEEPGGGKVSKREVAEDVVAVVGRKEEIDIPVNGTASVDDVSVDGVVVIESSVENDLPVGTEVAVIGTLVEDESLLGESLLGETISEEETLVEDEILFDEPLLGTKPLVAEPLADELVQPDEPLRVANEHLLVDGPVLGEPLTAAELTALLFPAEAELLFKDEPALEVDLELTLTEFAAELRTPTLLSQICRSREFQPSLENWWVSGVDQWLRDYTVANRNTDPFKIFGLAGSIAHNYLDSQDFGCGINPKGGFRPRTCRVSCLDVVAKVNDLEEAKRVFFVLAGIVGLSERVGIIHNAIKRVPQGVSLLVGALPTQGGLNTAPDAVSTILFSAVDSTLFAAAPWLPVNLIHEASYEFLKAAKHYYDMAVQVSARIAGGTDPYKWDKAFDSAFGMSLAEVDFAPNAYVNGVAPIPDGVDEDTWYSKAVLRTRRALEDARTLVVEIESGNLTEARAEGFELFRTLFSYDPESLSRKQLQDPEGTFGEALSDAARRARILLASVSTELLRGDVSTLDGVTDLSTLLRYGNYLPSGPSETISNFKRANIPEVLTRNIFMALFNNSIQKQLTYISCTEDKQYRTNPRKDLTGIRVDTCSRDNTGPQNLKACFGNMVCYLYEWNERSMSHMSRNRAPKGLENWDEEPWNLDIQDIILSSVATALQPPLATSPDHLFTTTTLSTLAAPSSANHFSIPVCFSAHNWNTPVSGYTTLCDTSKHCTAKNLPCQCGPSGASTIALWESVGLATSPKADFYSATLCPRQIQKKVADPLERYVAYCNLGIKRRGCGGSRVDGPKRYQGRDKYCGIVTSAVARTENGLVGELDPETRYMFLCQIQKGGRGCGMYKSAFAELWEASQLEAIVEEEEGAKMAGN